MSERADRTLDEILKILKLIAKKMEALPPVKDWTPEEHESNRKHTVATAKVFNSRYRREPEPTESDLPPSGGLHPSDHFKKR